MTKSSETRLGEVLVREGLIKEAQLRDVLKQQAAGTTYVPLGHLLVRQKLLTQRQLNLVLEHADKRPKLGEVLARSGAITADQLQHALNQQKKLKLPIGQLLVRLSYITDETMRQALSVQLNVPYLDLDRLTIDPALSRIINRSYARRRSLVPVASIAQSLTVCMDDPTDHAATEELSRLTGCVVTVVTASHEAIGRAFERLYSEKVETTTENLDLVTEDEKDPGKSRYVDDYRQSKNADALVRQLLSMAIERRSSDIHLETLSNRLQIRFRIDGVLEEMKTGDLQTACNQGSREIVSRLKILGKLDIAERRRPQDGSFRVRVDRRGEQANVDLRISVVPGYYGESVVLRILDRKRVPGSIDQLGFSKPAVEKLRQLLRRPSGILLATGPTGSGKSTTLYSSLMTLYRPQLRILTAEDPVEYIYEQFSQSEVNEQIGNTFASYLRAFLRHDPEIIMVGEIRDEETAEMAFRAAQTGHLLLSTLHTNTAVAAVARLLDLKVDPNMLASSLIGVLGQRLVREVCASCRVEYQPSDELMREFFEAPPEAFTFYKGGGCNDCNFTGFHGRTTVAELWVPNEEDLILITKGAPFEELRASSRRTTLSMADDALDRLVEGRTNLDELIRMLPYSSIYEFRQRGLGRGLAVPAPVAAS
jgi:type II secretory ATPase GspE/PulE/Tfp pilus assembly ATPase PilB-like protein